MKRLAFFLFLTMTASLNACAMAPVESDPAAAQARYTRMADDCYKRGGTWNDNVKTCVGADLQR
jgi:hypothetical protein